MPDTKTCTVCGGSGRSLGLVCLTGGKTMQVTQPCGVCGGSGQMEELEISKQMDDQRIITSQDIIDEANEKAERDEKWRIAWQKRVLEAEAQLEMAEEEITKLWELLNDCKAHLEQSAEAEHDGDRWIPNDEMVLVSRIDDLVGGVQEMPADLPSDAYKKEI